MNKKCAFLAVAGLVVLTGCTPKIMSQRVYTPSDAAGQVDNADGKAFGEVPAAENTPTGTPDIAVKPFDGTPAPAPAPAPAQSYNGFAPMEGSAAPAGLSGKAAPKKAAGKKVYAKGGTYVVKSGDTLGGIARRHGVSLGALLEANKMTMQDAKKLTVGRKLVIPAAGKKAAVGKKGASAAPAVAAEKGYYIVQRGDFPQKIARKNKVKLADLLKANNLTMDSARRLQIGQKLIIPGKGAVSAAPAAKETPAAPVEQKPVQTAAPVSQVEKADNAAVKIEESMPVEDNKTTSAPAGSTSPVEISEDITVKDFAAKYKVTEEWLRNENPTISGDTIKKGDFIMVPSQN